MCKAPTRLLRSAEARFHGADCRLRRAGPRLLGAGPRKRVPTRGSVAPNPCSAVPNPCSTALNGCSTAPQHREGRFRPRGTSEAARDPHSVRSSEREAVNGVEAFCDGASARCSRSTSSVTVSVASRTSPFVNSIRVMVSSSFTCSRIGRMERTCHATIDTGNPVSGAGRRCG